jgi:ubiquinone/menaquinone biosynthesis C-methylase UbiE
MQDRPRFDKSKRPERVDRPGYTRPGAAAARLGGTSVPSKSFSQPKRFKRPEAPDRAAVSERKTSWGKVAHWYDDMLEKDQDTYQAQVVLPNLMRVLALKKGETVVELGSGQGYFAREFAKAGARVIGVEIGEELVKIAKQRSKMENIPVVYHVASADRARMIADCTADTVVMVLALQNMKQLNDVMQEARRITKPRGRIVIVMSHPAFRIPRQSHWGFDEESKTQFRRVDQYLSDAEIAIDMNPGFTAKVGWQSKSRTTHTYHHSLQTYMKAFAKVGFAIARLEEWISHRESQKGPRQQAEDRARKEIPLFMCLELKRLN